MSGSGLGTLPVPRPPVAARPAARPVAPARRSAVRRRWGVAAGLVLMLATLPVHLLGIALVALEVLSPSTDGSAPLLVGGVGLAELLLLTGVASVAQLIGGPGDVWRRRFALSCVNALIVVVAATVAWLLLA